MMKYLFITNPKKKLHLFTLFHDLKFYVAPNLKAKIMGFPVLILTIYRFTIYN